MQNDMKLIQDCGGVYNSMLGQDSNATSGVAIANLVEQGTTTLAELNDNFHYSRNKVADLLLAYLIEDLVDRDNVTVIVNRKDKARRKEITLNGADDGSGRTNDVTRWRGHIALMPMPATPTYRQQQALVLNQAMAHVPEAAKPAIAIMLVELMDIPNKQEVLDSIRQSLNIAKDPEDMSEEEQQAAAKEQQKLQVVEDMQMQEMQGNIDKLALERDLLAKRIGEIVKKTETEAVKDDKLIAETEKILQDIKLSNAEVAARKFEMTNLIQSQLDSIEV